MRDDKKNRTPISVELAVLFGFALLVIVLLNITTCGGSGSARPDDSPRHRHDW